ncbi:divalent-cation tolerance protein CutA [Streptomyces sp. NBC_01498]|uniref:divalent-cation tolerance protein CutA n=1 Tax=Streptomyces sp. NBC_01498 TaxID=2975870 RepID=UPI002E7BE2B9|nr:divalent-cation tolerance protein CutA [Streptomyces sp. NBC_01498]WTL26897.1 divalent-cation tolerance protein CutA [Streptomyces sp. NBC_01498]
MTEFVQVSTATGSREQAVQLAQSVVRARPAAGAQVIGPVTSVFWHNGEFGTGVEWQLLMKTRADRFPALEAHLLEHRPWDSPEVSAVPVVAGAETCLRWVASSTEAE